MHTVCGDIPLIHFQVYLQLLVERLICWSNELCIAFIIYDVLTNLPLFQVSRYQIPIRNTIYSVANYSFIMLIISPYV